MENTSSGENKLVFQRGPSPFGKDLEMYYVPERHAQVHIADQWGFVPMFIENLGAASFREAVDKSYLHGGGWRELPDAKPGPNFAFLYPGDPANVALSLFFNPLTFEIFVAHSHAFFSVWRWKGSEETTLARAAIVAADTENWEFNSVTRID